MAIDSDGKITITADAEADNSGTYTVTATAGPSSNYKDGTQKTATVIVTIAKRNFSTVALSYSETTIRAVETFPNDVGIEPEWTTSGSDPNPIGITYDIAYGGSGTDGSTGDSPVVAIDTATGKITLTAAAVVANSGTYTVTATASGDSNYFNDGPLTAVVTVEITVAKASLADTSFAYTEVKAAVGTANDIGVSPSWAGYAPPVGATYEISGGAGAGNTVNIDSDNGKITITNAATTDHSGDYTVTVTAGSNSNYAETTKKTATATVTIKLNLNTVGLAYTEVTAIEGAANTTGVEPQWTGTPTPAEITYSITGYEGTGVKDSGVVIDAGGKITITDAAKAANSGTYTVTATAKASSNNYAENTTQTADVTVTIKLGLSKVGLSYTEVTATEGTANSTGVEPQWTGTPTPAGIAYSITGYNGDGVKDPGVEIDAGGKITITDAAEAVNSGTYTVTATAGPSSNYKDGTQKTATVVVTIKRNLNTVGLSYTEVETTEGTANTTGVIPTWTTTGNDPTPTDITYSITGYDGNGEKDAGVEIDPDNGTITITASAIAANSGPYTVTATAKESSNNYAENTTQTAIVTVTIAKRDLNTATFSYAAVATTEGTAIAAGAGPVWTPATGAPDPNGINYSVTGYSGDGEQDAGVGTDADGKITITDAAKAANSGTYTVTATAGESSNYA